MDVIDQHIVDEEISDPRALASEHLGLNEVVDEDGYVSWSDSDEESESEGNFEMHRYIWKPIKHVH